MRSLDVFISGVHSDPDPSPGVGIARSLRECFPDARLIGVDYSIRSSGLHHPVFDAVLVEPVWGEMDLATHAEQIRARVDGPAVCWISGLDVEVEWLANVLERHPRVLAPDVVAQQAVRKPRIAVADSLGMRIPRFLPASAPADALHQLGRRAGWRLWVKGQYHEAYPAYGFADLRRQIERMSDHWPLDDVFVQEHVHGVERAITFSAYGGQLLGAVAMEKRAVTPQGKTWAGAVTAVTADQEVRLQAVLTELQWTGGGEVEFVRDAEGRDWLIDFNPRFPAYIHGVTLCGANLPGALVAAAVGLPSRADQQHPPDGQFVRVVHELPVRRGLSIPALPDDPTGALLTGKHPSFQPALVRRLRGTASRGTHGGPDSAARPRAMALGEPPEPPVPDAVWRALADPGLATPRRLRDAASPATEVRTLAAALSRCAARPRVVPALSVKTDPHPSLAQAFREAGWWIEVISAAELRWARAQGFEDDRIVFNGPGAAAFARGGDGSVAVVNADSAETLEALQSGATGGLIGVRIRPHVARSRFGVDLADHGLFRRVVDTLRAHGARAFGVHLHSASDTSGPRMWWDMLEHALAWGAALADASGARCRCVDVGGGWHRADWRDVLLPALPTIQARVHAALPDVDTILLEPGKAVSAGGAWLAARLIEVRRRGDGELAEVVADASVADLPMAPLYAHNVLHCRAGRALSWLGGGTQRVLGAICMETDVLADQVRFDTEPRAGDLLLFEDAGGYNASMAWPFASGVSRDG